jgi:hypothetical protein
MPDKTPLVSAHSPVRPAEPLNATARLTAIPARPATPVTFSIRRDCARRRFPGLITLREMAADPEVPLPIIGSQLAMLTPVWRRADYLSGGGRTCVGAARRCGLRAEIGQLPDAAAGALPRAWDGRAGTGLNSWRNAVHSYLTPFVAAEQVRRWRQWAAEAQRAGQARRGRRARRIWRWPVVWLSRRRGRGLSPAGPVLLGQPWAGGRPGLADDRQRAGTHAA